jgi:hypothetical protein
MKTLSLVCFCGWIMLFGLGWATTPSSVPSSSNSNQRIHPASEEQEEYIVSFTPPAGWYLADLSSLATTHVKVMVRGQSGSYWPPSMNLSWESFAGTLKDYLKLVKNRNQMKGEEWKDLGSIQTEAGLASLSQVDHQMPWGEMRFMHAILVKDEKAYIITASAPTQDFRLFYKDFFTSMRSLRISRDACELVTPEERQQLKTAADQLEAQWQVLFAQYQQDHLQIAENDLKEGAFTSDLFQNKFWKPFEKMLQEKYGRMGMDWQSLFLQKMKDRLFNR